MKMQIQFLAKVHIFDSLRLAVYVPKSAIEFYFPGIDLKEFKHASWHDDQYFYRTSVKDEWKFVGGYLGYYGSRKTLRLVFGAYRSDRDKLIGKMVQFCVKFDLNADMLHSWEIKKKLFPEIVEAEKEEEERKEEEKWQRVIDSFQDEGD